MNITDLPDRAYARLSQEGILQLQSFFSSHQDVQFNRVSAQGNLVFWDCHHEYVFLTKTNDMLIQTKGVFENTKEQADYLFHELKKRYPYLIS